LGVCTGTALRGEDSAPAAIYTNPMTLMSTAHNNIGMRTPGRERWSSPALADCPPPRPLVVSRSMRSPNAQTLVICHGRGTHTASCVTFTSSRAWHDYSWGQLPRQSRFVGRSVASGTMAHSCWVRIDLITTAGSFPIRPCLPHAIFAYAPRPASRPTSAVLWSPKPESGIAFALIRPYTCYRGFHTDRVASTCQRCQQRPDPSPPTPRGK